jgi:hypothetical protein
MACIGVRSVQTLSDRFLDEVTGSFGPEGDIERNSPIRAFFLLAAQT